MSDSRVGAATAGTSLGVCRLAEAVSYHDEVCGEHARKGTYRPEPRSDLEIKAVNNIIANHYERARPATEPGECGWDDHGRINTR